jgi:hypothetical protein
MAKSQKTLNTMKENNFPWESLELHEFTTSDNLLG